MECRANLKAVFHDGFSPAKLGSFWRNSRSPG
ncbi:hypothetical protein FTO70_03740 [Methanosarcina sp. KYL-1]|nr:hypothetical protein [Methanosarcina sp. KYL-1]